MKTPRGLFGRWLGINASLMLLAGGGMAQALDVPFCPLHAAISWSKVIGDNGRLLGCDRTQLSGSVYQYQAWVKVGPGLHDLIGIHRVVQEQSPWRPVGSARAVMLLPGDASSFGGNFLSKSAPVPADQALGVYLAQNNVDVGRGLPLEFCQHADDGFFFHEKLEHGQPSAGYQGGGECGTQGAGYGPG